MKGFQKPGKVDINPNNQNNHKGLTVLDVLVCLWCVKSVQIPQSSVINVDMGVGAFIDIQEWVSRGDFCI